MASQRRHTSGILQLLVISFLLYEARSSKYCEYSSFISDIVLESCVRRELATKVNTNNHIKGSTSQLTEYTDIWAKCSEVAKSSYCNATRQHNHGVLDLKMHILNIWSELDEKLDSTRNEDSPEDEMCLDNFKHSVRTCLPIIKAYAFGLGKEDLKVLRYFMNCISLEINSCDETARKILFDVMEKNVHGRVLASGDSMESLKECLEVVDQKKLEKCSPGFLDFLLKVADEDLIISVDSIILSNNSCTLEALKSCDAESLKVINELAEIFLNTTVYKATEISFRRGKVKNFVLMPDDREEIRECLETSVDSEVNACVPGLFNLLESIANGEPQEKSLLRSARQRTACLGIAFRRCPGSTRFIMRKTIQALYGTILDIPFDRNSILSRPGQYENHILEILFPYYTIPDHVSRSIRDCLEKTVCSLVHCCGELPDAMVNVLLNKSLQFPISQKSDCIEPCYSAVFNECSEEGASHTARLLYSVKLAYNKLEALGINHLPVKPPYKLPAEVFVSISLCLQHVDPTTLENCCPGIIDIIHAFVKNKPIPFKFVTPRNCKYECVLYATSACEITSASHLQSFIAFAIKMYESIPSTSALVQQEDSNFGIERVGNNIKMPKKYLGLIATCFNNISMQLNSCCPAFYRGIRDILNNEPLENCKDELKWCTKFCYEPLFLQCKRPEIMLQLAKTILELIVNSTWDDVLFIVIFPPEPPYRLPRDIIAGVTLCLEMVGNLGKCCPLLPTALSTIIEDKPWISQKFNLTSCETSCYKQEINRCPAESRDITLGLIIGLLHFNEISVNIYTCLQIIKPEFSRCCPGMIEILFNTLIGNEHCIKSEQFEKTCDILCAMQSLRKCEVITADIVQKAMKYIFEYEPICSNQRNAEFAINRKYYMLDVNEENKEDRINETKKPSENFFTTKLSSEYVTVSVDENLGKNIESNYRKDKLEDLYEASSEQKYRKIDDNARPVESYKPKNMPVTENSNEKQRDFQWNTNNFRLFTVIDDKEFGERKNDEIRHFGYGTKKSSIINAKDLDKIIVSEETNRENGKDEYEGLKYTDKYESQDKVSDFKMGETLWRTSFNAEDKDNSYYKRIVESGLNFETDDRMRSTTEKNDYALYEYDVSARKKDTPDLKQMRNLSNKKSALSEFSLTLGNYGITTIHDKMYFNSKYLTAVPEDQNDGRKDENDSSERKDYIEKFNASSSTFQRENEYEDFFAGLDYGRSNDTKKLPAVQKVGTNNFDFVDDVISFNKNINKEDDEELGGSKSKNLNYNNNFDVVTNSWNTTSRILDWQNGAIYSGRKAVMENINTPNPDAAYFKRYNSSNMNWKSGAKEIIDSKEAIGLEKGDDSEVRKSIIGSVYTPNTNETYVRKYNSSDMRWKSGPKEIIDSKEAIGLENVDGSEYKESIIESVYTPNPNAAYIKRYNNSNMRWKSGPKEIINSKEALGLSNVDESEGRERIIEILNTPNPNAAYFKRHNSSNIRLKSGSKEAIGFENVDDSESLNKKQIGRKMSLSTKYPLETDSSGRFRTANKQPYLKQNNNNAGFQIFDDSEDIMRIQDTKKLVKSNDTVKFDGKVETKKLGKSGDSSNDSRKKFRTRGYRYRANFDPMYYDLYNDNEASTDEVRISSGDETEENSDYASLLNITDKISFEENVGTTETSNESVVFSESYESTDSTKFTEGGIDGEYDEDVTKEVIKDVTEGEIDGEYDEDVTKEVMKDVTEGEIDGEYDEDVSISTNTTYVGDNFTTEIIFDQETTVVIADIEEEEKVESEIKDDYTSTDSYDDFTNADELTQDGRKRRNASENLQLKRINKYVKHIKKKETNNHGALNKRLKTIELIKTNGLHETGIKKKIGNKHSKKLKVTFDDGGFTEFNGIKSNSSYYKTANTVKDISTSGVVDSKADKKFNKDKFKDFSKTTKFKILEADGTNSIGYTNSTHKTFDDLYENHKKFGYDFVKPHETYNENINEVRGKVGKNIYDKDLGVETRNTGFGITNFSDSGSIAPNQDKDFQLVSSRHYDTEGKYMNIKASEDASSNFKRKVRDIDQNLERNVKSKVQERRQRSIYSKRVAANDDMKIDSKKDGHVLSLEALRKIEHKNYAGNVNKTGHLDVDSRKEKTTGNEGTHYHGNKSDISSESGISSGKNLKTNGTDLKGKGITGSVDIEGQHKLNLKEAVKSQNNNYAIAKDGRDEEEVWPSTGGSAAEIGIIEQLPALYGKNAFRDDFVLQDADGDPTSRISSLTVEAETSVIRCTKVMSPILMKCCRPLLEALYAVINDEHRPLDEQNLKRCDHFCYTAALKYCSPKAARITSIVIRNIKRYPLLGDAQFVDVCNKTIQAALNNCCDILVLKVFYGNNTYEEKAFEEPVCTKICQKSVFQLCFRFKPLREYFMSLIKSHFGKKNFFGMRTISSSSSQVIPSSQNMRPRNYMRSDMRSNMGYRQLRTTVIPKPKRYIEPWDKISYSASDYMRHKRDADTEMKFVRDLKLISDGEEVFRIPAYFKKLARICIYMNHNTTLDECVPGIYDYILMLSNGVKINPPIITDVSKASACLNTAFGSCPTESVLVLNSLLQQFFDESINIINETAMKETEIVDEKTKGIVNTCINRAGADLVSSCIGNFYSIIKEILDKGQSTIHLDVTDQGVQCLAETLSVCSLKARLILMRLILEYKGILLNISLKPKSDQINIMKLIPGGERRSFIECFNTINEKEMDTCEPELYTILSELVKGSMKLPDTPLSGGKKCLGDVFRKCSFHSRLVIMDLVSFATDSTIDIPMHFPKETPVPITKEEQTVVRHCLSQLDPSIVENCLPGLLYVLNEVFENNIPDLSRIPVRITSTSCLKTSFANCSSDSRLFLTELVHRYTNVFVDLLFFITEDRVDKYLLSIAEDCIASIPTPLLNGCVKDLTTATEQLSRGFYPSSQLEVKLKERKPNCVNELFNRCSRYHRILIDQLMRKLTSSVTNADMFDILHPLNIYSGAHQHSNTDMLLVQQCFNTINEDYLNWCVPGLYKIIKSLTESKFPISVIALKPIEGSCLDMAFAECSYKSRILIKDLLYDFANLFVNISLYGSPQGQTGELGPPIEAIQECISSVNSTGSDSCVLGIIASLHKIFIEKVENPQPIVSADKEKSSMACLTELFKPCDLPIKVYLLKRIADISNVKVNFIMETFLIKTKIERKKKVVGKSSSQGTVNSHLKMRNEPLENSFVVGSKIQGKKYPFLNEISKLSAYQKGFGKTDKNWYDKLRYRGIYHPDDARNGCNKRNKVPMRYRTRNIY